MVKLHLPSVVDSLSSKSLADWRRTIDRRAALAYRGRVVEMRNRRPIATITFDDCPESAATIGARVLESYGVLGTYYVCGELVDRQWESVVQLSRKDLRQLVAHGHEIGCHTFTHRRVTDLSRAEFSREVTANRAFVRDVAGYEIATFAYPYGTVGLFAKRACDGRFVACRSIEPGVDHGTVDLLHVKSNRIPVTGGDDWLKPLIDQTVAGNGWLTLFTHDVCEAPTAYGCLPATLAAAVEALLAAGIEILPLRTAAAVIAPSDD